MDEPRSHPKLRGFCLLGGLLLTVIGIRYLVVPDSAAATFGLANPPIGHELHYMVGLRNVWLGVLAVAFAVLRQWHALLLWALTGTFVCFADAMIVAQSSGQIPQIAFHAGSGVACIVVAVIIGRFVLRASQSGQ